MQDLFGRRQAAAVVDLPTRINSIIKRLPPQTLHTANTLIDGHTLFPLYRPFLPMKRCERVVRLMTGETSSGNVHMTTGQTASCVLPLRFLRFCSSCILADQREYGEPYWHRSHQAPGVRVCHLHESWLADSGVAVDTIGARQSLALLRLENEGRQPVVRQARDSRHHTWLAVAVYRLLNDPSYQDTPDLQELRRRYLHHLHCQGFASATGRMASQKLSETFCQYYGNELLMELHCRGAADHAANWLLAVVRRPQRAAHPLHHLMLIRFLGLDIGDVLLGEVGKPRPFGRGPWPCLNPAAPHFRRAVVGTCTITSKSGTGTPVGTFLCKCGFVYSRSGPDLCPSDRLKVGRIVAVGPVWEERLSHLILAEKKSYRETARLLDVDSKTVKRHLELLLKHIKGRVYLIPSGKELNRRRANWQELCAANPGTGTRALRHLRGADYAWLYRRDRVWLQAHLPERRPPPARKGRVDWQERDSYLSSLVERAAKTMRQLPGRPTRVTLTSIWKLLGESASLCKKLDHLPRVRATLKTVLETKEEFAIRRLRLAAVQLRQQGEHATAWKLMREAGLRQSFHDTVAKELERLTRGDV